MSTTSNPLSDRERSLEAAFFHKVDAQLLEDLRTRLARNQDLERLAADTGIHDQEMLQELIDLGFTPRNLLALWLVPLTQVAWADGRVEEAERQAVLLALSEHGYSCDSPAWRLLESWLDHKPSEEVLTAWRDYAQAAVKSAGEKQLIPLRNELLKRAREVAEAAGGVFGIHPVSSAEEIVLNEMEKALRPEDSM